MAITYVPGYVPGGSSAKVGRAITNLASSMKSKVPTGPYGVPNPYVTTVNQGPTVGSGSGPYIGTLPSGYVPGITPLVPSSGPGPSSLGGGGTSTSTSGGSTKGNPDYLSQLTGDPQY